MTPLETRPYDAARFLQDEEDCRAYLDAALEDGDPRVIAAALGAIAHWKDMANVAEASGLGWREPRQGTQPGGEAPAQDPDAGDLCPGIPIVYGGGEGG